MLHVKFTQVCLVLLVVMLAVGIAWGGHARLVQAQSQCSTYHIVQFGENLYRIGLRYGIPYTTLAAVNGISNPNRIYTGQQLCIPGTSYTGTGYTGTTTGTTTTTGTLVVPPNIEVLPYLPFYYPLVQPPGATLPHQINYYPQYGIRYDDHSIVLEPAIAIWSPCQPEAVIYEQFLACSKTGLGWFYDFNMVDPATLAVVAPTATPAP